MKKCYICEENLTEKNRSEEHILISACGGKLKTKEIMCELCNKKIGREYDAELAKQLNYFSNILLIKRDRGHPQPRHVFSVSSGEEYYVDHNNKPYRIKPKISLQHSEIKYELDIEVNSLKELKNVLKGYKKRYPSIDIEDALIKAEEKYININHDLKAKVSIGGPIAEQSIAKTAIGYYLYKGFNRSYIKELINSLVNGYSDKYVEPIFFKYNLFDYGTNGVPHIIVITGDPNKKFLYSYVEYFGIYGFIVKMNSQYIGPPINENYYYDVLQRREIRKEKTRKIDSEILRDYPFNGSNEDIDILKEKIAHILCIANIRQQKNSIEKIIDNAFTEVEQILPNKEENIEEYNKKVMDLIIKDLYSFIMRDYQ